MAARLTDKQKKKIIADYVQIGSYNAVSKIYGVSATTVKNVVLKSADIVKLCEEKKEQNTADIMAKMEERKGRVCEIIDLYLDELMKMNNFKNLSPNQLTTALGTLIDKWAMIGGSLKDEAEEDGLSRSLRELGERLESDD